MKPTTQVNYLHPFQAYTGFHGSTWAKALGAWAYATPTPEVMAEASLENTGILFGFTPKAVDVLWGSDLPKKKAGTPPQNDIRVDSNRMMAILASTQSYRTLRKRLAIESSGDFRETIPDFDELILRADKTAIIIALARTDITESKVDTKKDGFRMEAGKTLCLVGLGRPASRFLERILIHDLPGARMEKHVKLERFIDYTFNFGPPHNKRSSDVPDRTQHTRHHSPRQMPANG